ncbi:hypothetical protein ACWGKW_11775 [Streptomyces sp. NPDC054766]
MDATVTGLGNGTNQGAAQVRNKSREPVAVSVGRGTMVPLADGKPVAERPLVPATGHQIQVTVNGRTITVRVDGTVTARWTSRYKATDITGGTGLRVGVNRAGAAWPSFSALAVKQLPDALPGPGGAQRAAPGAGLMDPAA